MRSIMLSRFMIFITYIGSVSAEDGNEFSFCFEDWHPFAYMENKKQAKGLHIDSLKTALEPSGYKAIFIEMPHIRCLKKVQEGDIDFALHVDGNDNIEIIDYSIGAWELTFAYSNNQESLALNNVNEQSKVLIASGYTYPKPVLDKLKSMFTQISTHSFNVENPFEIKALFKLVESGFVDAILVDKTWAKHEISKNNINVKLEDDVFHSELQFIGYIASNGAKARKVHRALAALSNEQ